MKPLLIALTAALTLSAAPVLALNLAPIQPTLTFPSDAPDTPSQGTSDVSRPTAPGPSQVSTAITK